MITINYQSRIPIYEQIVDRFEMLITTGVLKPGDQMPSVRSLSVKLAINPNTIQKAFNQLENEGYIYPVKGRGSFVADNPAAIISGHEKFLAGIKSAVSKGASAGVTRDEIVKILDEIYGGDNR